MSDATSISAGHPDNIPAHYQSAHEGGNRFHAKVGILRRLIGETVFVLFCLAGDQVSQVNFHLDQAQHLLGYEAVNSKTSTDKISSKKPRAVRPQVSASRKMLVRN